MGAGISVASFAEYDENTQTLISKECIGLKCDNDPCQAIFKQMVNKVAYEKLYEAWKKKQENNHFSIVTNIKPDINSNPTEPDPDQETRIAIM